MTKDLILKNGKNYRPSERISTSDSMSVSRRPPGSANSFRRMFLWPCAAAAAKAFPNPREPGLNDVVFTLM